VLRGKMLFIPLKYLAGSRFDTERTRVINNNFRGGDSGQKGLPQCDEYT